MKHPHHQVLATAFELACNDIAYMNNDDSSGTLVARDFIEKAVGVLNAEKLRKSGIRKLTKAEAFALGLKKR